MSTPGEELFTAAERRRLERLRLQPARPHGVPMLGERRSREFGTSGLFADHREYAVGDDLRYVDWNVYARLGDLVVKRFEAEDAAEILLLLDCSASMAGAKSKAARRLAGALGYVALGRHDRVRLARLPTDRQVSPLLFPGRGAVARLLEEVAAPVDAGRTNHAEDMGFIAASLRRRSMAVVVSDFYDDRVGTAGLALLRARGLEVVAIHVLDAADCDLPVGEALDVEDRETGRRVRVDVTPEHATAVRLAWRRHALRLEAWCRRRGIRHQRVDAGASLWDVLPRLLGAGARARRGA